MREIPLSQGLFAQVDDSDYDWLTVWKWCASKGTNTYYAVRHRGKKDSGNTNLICMHREIMNTPDNMQVDHEDLNGLNCQRHNMRNATNAQNNANKPGRRIGKYKGVHLRSNNRFIAVITVNYSQIYLGMFDSEIDAAQAYDVGALRYFGEFANLNFK